MKYKREYSPVRSNRKPRRMVPLLGPLGVSREEALRVRVSSKRASVGEGRIKRD